MEPSVGIFNWFRSLFFIRATFENILPLCGSEKNCITVYAECIFTNEFVALLTHEFMDDNFGGRSVPIPGILCTSSIIEFKSLTINPKISFHYSLTVTLNLVSFRSVIGLITKVERVKDSNKNPPEQLCVRLMDSVSCALFARTPTCPYAGFLVQTSAPYQISCAAAAVAHIKWQRHEQNTRQSPLALVVVSHVNVWCGLVWLKNHKRKYVFISEAHSKSSHERSQSAH